VRVLICKSAQDKHIDHNQTDTKIHSMPHTTFYTNLYSVVTMPINWSMKRKETNW